PASARPGHGDPGLLRRGPDDHRHRALPARGALVPECLAPDPRRGHPADPVLLPLASLAATGKRGMTARTLLFWRLTTIALVAFCVIVHVVSLGAPFVDIESWTWGAAKLAYEGDWRAAIQTYQIAVSSPPVVYWSIVPFYALFGVSERSARMPTLLFAVLTMVLIYLFTRRRFGEKTACLATMLLAASPFLWAFAGMICCNDVPFTLVTALLMIAVVEADRMQTTSSHLVAGVALGATLLTKFVAGIFPLVIGVILVRHTLASRGPSRVLRLLRNSLAYAPGVAAAALFYLWLGSVQGRIVNTNIAPARVDMLGTFLLLAPARLALY